MVHVQGRQGCTAGSCLLKTCRLCQHAQIPAGSATSTPRRPAFSQRYSTWSGPRPRTAPASATPCCVAATCWTWDSTPPSSLMHASWAASTRQPRAVQFPPLWPCRMLISRRSCRQRSLPWHPHLFWHLRLPLHRRALHSRSRAAPDGSTCAGTSGSSGSLIPSTMRCMPPTAARLTWMSLSASWAGQPVKISTGLLTPLSDVRFLVRNEKKAVIPPTTTFISNMDVVLNMLP